MNSLLTKRLPGILALGLVTLAVGAAGSPASAATSGGAHTSSLTPAQVKAKKRALKKCTKKSTARKRKACKRAVIKKYKRLANATPPIGKTVEVDLGDDFFAPAAVDLKVNDAILWNWKNVGGFEPHNVTLQSGPSGVDRTDFQSTTTVEKSTTFKRQFLKAGKYNFVCTIHFNMTMSVNVAN